MSKEKLLETLFMEWSNYHKDSPEYNKAAKMIESGEIVNEGYNVLVGAVISESEQAFTAGFNAAVALLTGGVQ